MERSWDFIVSDSGKLMLFEHRISGFSSMQALKIYPHTKAQGFNATELVPLCEV